MSTIVKIAVSRSGKVAPREERVALWEESGLAITREVGGRGYALTHKQSGYRVFPTHFPTLRKAKLAAGMVRHVTDWTQPRYKLERDRDLRTRMQTMRDLLRNQGLVG